MEALKPFLGWARTYKGTYRGSGTGYILVFAEDREHAKKKIEAHYAKEYPDQVIDEIKIGITIE